MESLQKSTQLSSSLELAENVGNRMNPDPQFRRECVYPGTHRWSTPRGRKASHWEQQVTSKEISSRTGINNIAEKVMEVDGSCPMDGQDSHPHAAFKWAPPGGRKRQMTGFMATNCRGGDGRGWQDLERS